MLPINFDFKKDFIEIWISFDLIKYSYIKLLIFCGKLFKIKIVFSGSPNFCLYMLSITFTFSHLADAFIQSDLQLGVHKAINLKEANIHRKCQ